MTYILGNRSRTELEGVHPDLIAVVRRAIELTPVDFSVHDGIRTRAEQQELVDRGASRTMNSRHITGHAVDLVPYINGRLRWEWEPIYGIAEAVRQAADELNVHIRWGGCWKIFTSGEYASTPVRQLVEDYVARRRAQGRSAFIDGPHYELPRNLYP